MAPGWPRSSTPTSASAWSSTKIQSRMVGAVAVDRQRPAFERVERDQRDQLLRELPGAVVVGGVADHGRQPVGVVPGAHQVVGGGLAGGIGAARIVGRRLGERRIAGTERAEHLVGGDVVEAERAPRGPVGQRGPVLARHVEQRVGADDIGAARTGRARRSNGRRGSRPPDASPRRAAAVANTARMAAWSAMSARTSVWRGSPGRLLQRVLGGGVGHLVDVDDGVPARAQEVTHHGGADEPTTAGQQHPHARIALACRRADPASSVSPAQSLSFRNRCMSTQQFIIE